MDNTLRKKQIIEACRQAVEESAQRTQQTMGNLITDSTESNEETGSDKYESKDEEMIEDSRIMEPHLEFLQRELLVLEAINPETQNAEVGVGAVVITDSLRFLVAVSAQFKVGNEDFVGISAAAPIFEEMQGRKAGEKFGFNGKDYKITEVF